MDVTATITPCVTYDVHRCSPRGLITDAATFSSYSFLRDIAWLIGFSTQAFCDGLDGLEARAKLGNGVAVFLKLTIG